MSIYKITYSERHRRLNLYHHGCNFNCLWCSYRLLSSETPSSYLDLEVIGGVLDDHEVERVHLLGGEPTLNSQLPQLLDMIKERGAITKIGHSNGWNPPPNKIDEMNISIKMLDDAGHRAYCGVSNSRVLNNLRIAHRMGVKLDTSSVLIPGLVDGREIDRIARFISSVDQAIPYHVVGYIPVPGAPWRRPGINELKDAVERARVHLDHVTFSSWSEEDFRNPRAIDSRYDSVRVA